MPELKNLPLIELGFDEADEFNNGITAISLVKSPAIKSKFVAYSDQVELKYKTTDEEKRLVIGPVLIPDLPIYRRDKDGKEYYQYMSAATIEKLAYSYLKNGRQNNATVEHSLIIQGVNLVESWVIEDKATDKANSFGITEPKGTWMGVMKIDNEVLWNDYVKTGKIEGFSIEGLLGDVQKSEQSDEILEKRIDKAISVLAKLASHGENKK